MISIRYRQKHWSPEDTAKSDHERYYHGTNIRARYYSYTVYVVKKPQAMVDVIVDSKQPSLPAHGRSFYRFSRYPSPRLATLRNSFLSLFLFILYPSAYDSSISLIQPSALPNPFFFPLYHSLHRNHLLCPILH